MSTETTRTLNQQTLIGYTDKRGKAWHYRAEDQGDEPNHYAGAIPVEDVTRRLFNWQAVSGEVSATRLTDTGVLTSIASNHQAIMRSDTGAVLGIFSKRYVAHQYDEWLVQNVSTILDAQLQIGSAGLLKGGAQAWVQIEMPETMEAAEGVLFRPFLTAATSLDGSLATTYLTGAQVVVCDNTLSAALGTADDKIKVRHSTNSLSKINDVRAGLGIVHQIADEFEDQVKRLTSEFVSDALWQDFLARLTYVSPGATTRSINTAERKQDAMNRLWSHDERVAPWKNSAYGVLAAVNTYEHHEKTIKGASRAERNMSRVVTGGVDKLDASTLQMLALSR
jgi:phage/plasmid-like protein (TIGR03299 family)